MVLNKRKLLSDKSRLESSVQMVPVERLRQPLYNERLLNETIITELVSPEGRLAPAFSKVS